MRKISAILCTLILMPLTGWTDNACVTCHQSLTPSLARAHDFTEWQRSIHAKRGVTCEQCHGGNPLEQDRQKAHKGMVPSQQKKSPLHFQRIPATCGGCHAAELAAFKKSYHLKELKRSGRGPNCLTCHGSMATSILQPQEMDQTCSVCHTQPKIASEALVTLNLAGTSLARWEKLFATAQARGRATAADTSQLRQQQAAYADVRRQWHAFEMDVVITRSQQIVSRAQQALQALKLKLGAR